MKFQGSGIFVGREWEGKVFFDLHFMGGKMAVRSEVDLSVHVGKEMNVEGRIENGSKGIAFVVTRVW